MTWRAQKFPYLDLINSLFLKILLDNMFLMLKNIKFDDTNQNIWTTYIYFVLNVLQRLNSHKIAKFEEILFKKKVEA